MPMISASAHASIRNGSLDVGLVLSRTCAVGGAGAVGAERGRPERADQESRDSVR